MRAFLCNFFSDSEKPADINRLNEFCTADTSTEHYIAVNGGPFPRDDKETAARLRPAVHRYLTQRSPNSVFVKTHNFLGEDSGVPLLTMECTVGAIYIVRNPLDVAVSFSWYFGKTVDESLALMADQNAHAARPEHVYQLWTS